MVRCVEGVLLSALSSLPEYLPQADVFFSVRFQPFIRVILLRNVRGWVLWLRELICSLGMVHSRWR